MMPKVWDEQTFCQLLAIEHRRAGRFRKPFVLMLLDLREGKATRQRFLPRALPAVASSTRETDLVGWKEQSNVLGVIFTEVCCDQENSIMVTLRTKVETGLRNGLGIEFATLISISLRILPEDSSPVVRQYELQNTHAGQVLPRELYPAALKVG